MTLDLPLSGRRCLHIEADCAGGAQWSQEEHGEAAGHGALQHLKANTGWDIHNSCQLLCIRFQRRWLDKFCKFSVVLPTSHSSVHPVQICYCKAKYGVTFHPSSCFRAREQTSNKVLSPVQSSALSPPKCMWWWGPNPQDCKSHNIRRFSQEKGIDPLNIQQWFK